MKDTRSRPKPQFDTARMVDDMALRGWLPRDLARQAGVSDVTVSRFLRGSQQNAKNCKQLADALGYSVRRYLISSRERVA
jgi:transcriptional regulator with XRE-family HTH domain